MKQPNKMFTFTAVVEIPITVIKATQILSGPEPGKDMSEYILENFNIPHSGGAYECGNLKTSLGRHLADEAVEECRLLELSTGEVKSL